jgi:signal peptidase II
VLIPGIILAVIACDQLAKYLITLWLSVHESIPLISGILHLTLVRNTGAAFGILRGRVPLFIATSLLAIGLIFWNLAALEKERSGMLSRVGLALVCAGAAGNLIDRLRFGYVVDFIDLRVWPVFNIADSAITVGALLLGASLLIRPRNDKDGRGTGIFSRCPRRSRGQAS